MFKRYLSLALAALLIQFADVRPSFAGTKLDPQDQSVEKVKMKVAKLGTGEKARVKIRLHDQTKLKGYVSQAGENDFVIRDAKTGTPTNVFYRDVDKVESNKGHSTAKAIAIGAGVGAGAFLALVGIVAAVALD